MTADPTPAPLPAPYEIRPATPALFTISPHEWAIAITPEPGRWFKIGYDGRIDASPDFQPSEAATFFAQHVGPLLATYRAPLVHAQEPVAWQVIDPDPAPHGSALFATEDAAKYYRESRRGTGEPLGSKSTIRPLYASPPVAQGHDLNCDSIQSASDRLNGIVKPCNCAPSVAGAPTHEPIQVGGGRYTCPKCGESYHGSEYHECPSTGAPS